MCEPKSGGGAEISFSPSLESGGGGRAPPNPPCSYAYEIIIMFMHNNLLWLVL